MQRTSRISNNPLFNPLDALHATAGDDLNPTNPLDATHQHPLKVAYQGTAGAYSEKAARELLGPRIKSVACDSFEDAFRAVASRDCDYACVPIENSLGGSIHTNFDLLLRYDLHIIAEHEFRVEHSLLALPGVKKEDIKKVMSHPQALAQCDNYLRDWGVKGIPEFDTAGSAKMIADGDMRNCAAIASDLAGETYGLELIDTNIEDHDNNFTRFLLLSRQSVSTFVPPNSPAKTSIVFVLPNNAGALYKALACFSLREIDFCKIESRPTPAKVLDFLQDKQAKGIILKNEEIMRKNDNLATDSGDKGYKTMNEGLPPRFRYTFYLDFLAAEFDDNTQNALMHLREQSSFVRVLGSFPKGSRLLGPIKATLQTLNKIPVTTEFPSTQTPVRDKKSPLKIGIVGFGKFGQVRYTCHAMLYYTRYAIYSLIAP